MRWLRLLVAMLCALPTLQFEGMIVRAAPLSLFGAVASRNLCRALSSSSSSSSSSIIPSTSSAVSSSSSSLPPPLSDRPFVKPTRFRQHVNPLSDKYQQPRFSASSSSWVSSSFKDPSLPLHVDIGCGKGGFCMEMAAKHPGVNFLGLEIREPVHLFSVRRREALGLDNCNFLSCNVNVDLDNILQCVYKFSRVKTVTVQFPDPHFKAKHSKRRVVTPAVVDCLGRFLAHGDERVFLQSDVKAALDDMRATFRENPAFVDMTPNKDEYLSENPMGVLTEREVSSLANNLTIYRALFTLRQNMK